MLRANIYSVETLPDRQKRAMLDGLDLVGTYIGENIVSKYCRVKLPQTADGKVKPERVGFAKLDIMVDLHLMAVPMEPMISGAASRAGLAQPGRGIAFIDTSSPSDVLRFVSAHETAHSLSFLRPDAWQREIGNPRHCCSAECIMHAQTKPVVAGMAELEKTYDGLLESLKILGIQGLPGQPGESLEDFRTQDLQQDFCSPCRADLRAFGQDHVAGLRTARILSGQV